MSIYNGFSVPDFPIFIPSYAVNVIKENCMKQAQMQRFLFYNSHYSEQTRTSR